MVVLKQINIPVGIFEKAQIGIKLMKDAIEELIKVNSKGITNSDCAHYLGLQRDHGGQQQNYLTYSVLGILLKENRIIGKKKKSLKEPALERKLHFVNFGNLTVFYL